MAIEEKVYDSLMQNKNRKKKLKKGHRQKMR